MYVPTNQNGRDLVVADVNFLDAGLWEGRDSQREPQVGELGIRKPGEKVIS